MAELTELQKERISYHLGYVARKYYLQVSQDTALIVLNPSQKLALVGKDLEELTSDEIYIFEGVELCSNTSALGKVERSYQNLDPSVIDDSLFVSQAGSVSLRGNELSNREKLYKTLVRNLDRVLTGNSGNSRVGW